MRGSSHPKAGFSAAQARLTATAGRVCSSVPTGETPGGKSGETPWQTTQTTQTTQTALMGVRICPSQTRFGVIPAMLRKGRRRRGPARAMRVIGGMTPACCETMLAAG